MIPSSLVPHLPWASEQIQWQLGWYGLPPKNSSTHPLQKVWGWDLALQLTHSTWEHPMRWQAVTKSIWPWSPHCHNTWSSAVSCALNSLTRCSGPGAEIALSSPSLTVTLLVGPISYWDIVFFPHPSSNRSISWCPVRGFLLQAAPHGFKVCDEAGGSLQHFSHLPPSWLTCLRKVDWTSDLLHLTLSPLQE